MEQWKKLCDVFHLGTPVRFQEAGGTRNRNGILHTDRGTWFVRERYSAYCRMERIQFDHAAAEFWAAHRLPVIPPQRTKEQLTYWNDGERVWEAYLYRAGRHLRDGDPNDLSALAVALARLHDTGRSFPLRYEKAAPRGETDPGRLLKRIAEFDPPLSCTSIYQRAIESAALELPDDLYLRLPYTLIHGDLQPANILVHEGRIAAFVDLDWCMWLPRLYDLSIAIVCCCASHKTAFDGGDIWSLTQCPILNESMIYDFIKRYEAEGTPFTPEERAALYPQLILTWCEMRLDGAHKVSPERRAEFLGRPPHDILDYFTVPNFHDPVC